MYAALLIGILALSGGQVPPPESNKYDCLSKEVQLDEVVSFGRKPSDNVTVKKKLSELKARCHRKTLVDGANNEIRFFRVSCWGNPPSDYLEIKQKEKEQFEKLKKDYTVIVIGCNPRIN
jgi:hypothetical protein